MKIADKSICKWIVSSGIMLLLFILVYPNTVYAFNPVMALAPALHFIRVEFILFAFMLMGIAVFHRHTMSIALAGLVTLIVLKYLSDPPFSLLHHIAGTTQEPGEWKTLCNLSGLLLGFAVLAEYFRESRISESLTDFLPIGWKGNMVLLLFVFIISGFLDNIAAAMIGGATSVVIYKKKVHIGFLAAIVAASNAGGAGSVIGDTTTTLLWVEGVHPFAVVKAYIAAGGAFLVFGLFGSLQQQRYQPMVRNNGCPAKIEWNRIFIVVLILICTIAANILIGFPAIGVWGAILICAGFVKTPWHEIRNSWKGTVFLTALVASASLMPVNELPVPSWKTTFFLGFVSAVFDNIPLTKLCLEQGNYDWGFLAYAVGFGGSMVWFGSSAGVALANIFPQMKSVCRYLIEGWHVMLGYVLGFMLLVFLNPWK
jgi:hypothetical protein